MKWGWEMGISLRLNGSQIWHHRNQLIAPVAIGFVQNACYTHFITFPWQFWWGTLDFEVPSLCTNQPASIHKNQGEIEHGCHGCWVMLLTNRNSLVIQPRMEVSTGEDSHGIVTTLCWQGKARNEDWTEGRVTPLPEVMVMSCNVDSMAMCRIISPEIHQKIHTAPRPPRCPSTRSKQTAWLTRPGWSPLKRSSAGVVDVGWCWRKKYLCHLISSPIGKIRQI